MKLIPSCKIEIDVAESPDGYCEVHEVYFFPENHTPTKCPVHLALEKNNQEWEIDMKWATSGPYISNGNS